MTRCPALRPDGQATPACARRAGRPRRATAWLALGAVLLGVVGKPCAQPPEDAALKVAILFNLLTFVEWPGEAGVSDGSPLRLCADSRGVLWPQLLALRERPLRRWRLDLRDLADGDNLRDCQILLLDAGTPRRRAIPRDQPALLVIGNDERADDAGVALDLHRSNGRVVFDVDLTVARHGGLKISSKLLRLARKLTE